MSTLKKLIELETNEIGYHEGANNDNKFGIRYGLNYEPWCVIFQWCMCKDAGVPFPDAAHCTYVRNYAVSKGQWVTGDYKAGDLFILPNDSHIGLIVEILDGGNVRTIEGNCGDAVSSITRNVSSFSGAYRPQYEEADNSEYQSDEDSEMGISNGGEGIPMITFGEVSSATWHKYTDDTAMVQLMLNKLGYDCGHVDGEYGARTKAMIRNFQHDRGLTEDGVVGPNTWSELFMCEFMW